MKLCIGLLTFCLVAGMARAQKAPPTISGGSFHGITASQLTSPGYDIDPSGAVGTKQFMEYVNTYYQAYSKVSPYTAVWATPQPFTAPFTNAGLSNCSEIT